MGKIISFDQTENPMLPFGNKRKQIIITEEIVTTVVSKITFEQLESELIRLYDEQRSIRKKVIEVKNKIKELSSVLDFDYASEIPIIVTKKLDEMVDDPIVEEPVVEEPIVEK